MPLVASQGLRPSRRLPASRRIVAEPNPLLADRAWLERRYRQDRATVAAIAAESGADPSTVHRALLRHGIALRGVSERRSLGQLSDATIKATVARSETTVDAARALGVDLSTLVQRLARMGLHAWPGGTEGADEMAAAYAAGASIGAIAAAHGCSTRTVRRRLAAAGVDMRPVGRPASESAR